MNRTNLQAALIDAGIETLSFNITGATRSVAIPDICDEGLIALLRYGTRKVNDRVNSQISAAKKAEESFDKAALVSACLSDIKAGVQRPARSHTDPFTRELRLQVRLRLNSLGIKNAEATKLTKNPKEGFTEFCGLYLAKALGKPLSSLESEQIQSIFDKNWPSVEKAAKKALVIEELDLGDFELPKED